MNNLILISFLFILTAHSEVNKDIYGKDLYNKVILKYTNAGCYRADLEITEFYNEKESITNGTYKAKGDKYKMSVTDQDVISNGKVVWMHDKDMSEITIIEYTPEDGGIMTLIRQFLDNNEITYLGKSENNRDVIMTETIKKLDSRTTMTELIYLEIGDDHMIYTFAIETVKELEDSEGVYSEDAYGHIFTLSNYKFNACADAEFELSEKELNEFSRQGIFVNDIR